MVNGDGSEGVTLNVNLLAAKGSAEYCGALSYNVSHLIAVPAIPNI